MVEYSWGLEKSVSNLLSTGSLCKKRPVTGALLLVVSAVVFSSAGLFVKGISADAWVTIFWRGLFAAVFTTCYVVYRGDTGKEFGCIGKPGVIAAIVGAVGTMSFIPAFKHTSIANVSLIYAASPFIAAAMMWVWVNEKPSAIVLTSSVVALLGVTIIFFGSLGAVYLTGDMLALGMTIAMALFVCIYRRYPNTPAAGPAVLLSCILILVACVFCDPFVASYFEILIMGGFGLVFSIASVTLAEGAKRLPAAETALISSLETPLAPLWAWVFLSEVPAVLTLVGGSIVLFAVYGSQFFG